MNQCMGCQAGWPLVRPGSHRVIGGYPHESVGCTAHLYGGATSRLCEDPLARAVDEGRQDAAAYMRRVRRMWGAGEG